MNSGAFLEQMMGETSESMHTINEAMAQIASSSQAQTKEGKCVSEKTDEIARLIGEVVEYSRKLKLESDAMKLDGEEAVRIMEELHRTNQLTNEAVENIDHQIHNTNKAVKEIHEAVAMISGIARQTSLLALNASIEAARAGESGKGFAVVADEIGKLSSQSNHSADSITQSIAKLTEESGKSVHQMAEVIETIHDQKLKLSSTMDRVLQVNTGISSHQKDIEEIQHKIQLCDQVRIQVVEGIHGLAALSESNSASTQEVTASLEDVYQNVQNLDSSAKKLKEVSELVNRNIGFFKA